MTLHDEIHATGVRVLILDRPERRNALDTATLGELLGALGAAGQPTSGTRVLVLRGAGGHFCSGADLAGVEDEGFTDKLRSVLEALRDAPFVTLAVLEGAALGAGTQLAVACDLRTATPDAKVGIPAARLGLTVDHWTVDRLARQVGQGPARAMLLAAEVLSGADAHRLGVAQREGDADDAIAWATEIAALAPMTISVHKLMLNRTEAPVVQDPEVTEARAAAWASDDFAEGLQAFAERRPPEFRGR